jgi:chromosome partitioning protein
MIRLVISNQRGGVAKTTTTHTLARFLADRGKRVLVIDTDPQGSMQVVLGLKFQRNLHDLVINGLALEDCVVKAHERIDVVCSDRSSMETEGTLMGRIGREFAFRNLFTTFASAYDAVLIDVAPSITLLQTCAMLYAERLLVPIAMDLLSLQGAAAALQTAAMLNGIFKADIRPVAFLPVMVNKQLQMTRLVLSQLEQMAAASNVAVLAETRNDVSVNKAAKMRQFLADFDPNSRIMQDYTAAFEQLTAILEGTPHAGTVEAAQAR